LRKGDHAAAIDAQGLAGLQSLFYDRTTGVNKCEAIAFELLQHKTFTAKEPGTQTFLKCDAERHAFCRAQESIFLTQQSAAQLRQIHRNDFAGICGTKSHFAFLSAAVHEHRGEHRFASHQTLTRAQQFAENAALRSRAVTEDRLHLHIVFHVKHRTGFADRRFIRVEFNFDKLHVVAENLIINNVHCHDEFS
jgi:hypothetical protein